MPIIPTPEPEEPAPDNQVSCSSDTYNCGDFSSCSEVMEIFNQCDNDPNRLDRDDDGVPCESLCS